MARGPHPLPWRLRLYLWLAAQLYGRWAWAYGAVSWLVSLGHWAEWRRQALPHLRGRVLEVGFGPGDLLVEMALRGVEVVGVDPSPAMHRIAARKLGRRGLAVPRVQAVAQAMPFSDASFDTVVTTFPSEYMADPATWREVARLLRASSGGGRWVVVGACVEYRHPLLARLVGLLFGRPPGQALNRWPEVAEEFGFRATLLEGDSRWVRVPVLLLEKVPVGQGKSGGRKPCAGSPPC
ncbi:MAG: class I SAM-dependent methyltransferase [Anaerolineae bacterium]